MKLKKFQYSNSQLKNGYEEMGKINLGFAESGLEGDAKDLVSYESQLVNTTMPWESDQSDD